MKTLRFLTLVLLLTGAFAFADGKLEFQATDTIKTVLDKQVGQKVEVRLKGGEKIAGKVEKVGDKAVHLSAIAGQELFDAVVVLDDVAAVLVRTGGK
jgi:hypothetical protein